MQKEDLVIEFHNKLNEVEEKYFKNRYLLLERRKQFLERMSLKRYGKLDKEFVNGFKGESDVIVVPFNYEFYINGYKCKIETGIEIKLLE